VPDKFALLVFAMVLIAIGLFGVAYIIEHR
jgi:hypothetical protein